MRSIFRENELATRSRVGSDGTVQLPFLGDVKVAGGSFTRCEPGNNGFAILGNNE